ncbi:hypothetical protein F4811DRAFT_548705 [Daldinia bambusicola]|nr:hypothetical protein F4811DRAFT_548705 [Daldinia bambusicola]
MHSFGKIAVSAVAALASAQVGSAAFLAIPAAAAAGIESISAAVGAAAAVGGTVVSAIKDRSVDEEQDYIKPRVPSRIERRQDPNQQAWNDCHAQLTGASITFSAQEPGNVLVEGIPSACMTLSGVVTGKYNAGNPVPMGTDKILFQNLSNDEINQIQSALEAHP